MVADAARVRAIAERVAAVVRAHPETNNVHLDWNEPSKVVRLEVDQNKARVVGVSSQDLSTFVNAVLTGHSVTYYRERDKLIEVRARAQPDERLDLGNLKDINIHTQSGRSIPLSQVVTLRYDFEEPIIWRRNRLPTVTVRGDIVAAVQAPDVTARIDPLLDPIRAELPDDYHIEIGGAVEESRKGQHSVAAVVPIMVIVIVTLLMIQLQNVSRMLLVLLTAPLGIIGVTLFLLRFSRAVWLRGDARRDRARRHDHAQLGDPGRSDRPGHRCRAATLAGRGGRHRAALPADRADGRGGDPGHDPARSEHLLGADGHCHHGRAAGGDLAYRVLRAGAVCGMVPPAAHARTKRADVSLSEHPSRLEISPSCAPFRMSC